MNVPEFVKEEFSKRIDIAANCYEEYIKSLDGIPPLLNEQEYILR